MRASMLRGFITFFTVLLLGTVNARAQAQDVAGTWQGTLHAGKDLRVVLKITNDDGKLKCNFYSIDQGAGPIPSTVAQQGTGVKVAIAALGGGYDGKLAADGSSMSGTWTQGPASLPLNLARTTPETAWAIPEPPKKVAPMAAGADPSFEVATIKPSKPEVQGRIITVKAGRLVTVNTPLLYIMSFVYNVSPHQISGMPAWAATERYDITAQPDTPGEPSMEQWKSMARKMLAERFQLKFHDEKHDLPAYVLTVAGSGAKLTRSAGDAEGLPGIGFRGLGDLVMQNATLRLFADTMQGNVLDRPVVDQTGLPGRYDFTLKWTPDESQFSGMGVKIQPPSDAANAPPPLFTAIQEQLGLKLTAMKAPVTVLAVDHVDHHSAN